MAQLRCTDGRLLEVRPVPVLDREGTPYEVTLQLLLDGHPFGDVGERCGWFVADLARRLEDDVPAGTLERGVRAWAREHGQDADAAWAGLVPHVGRDCELFAFRSRDPDDAEGTGELRGTLRRTRAWGGRGWQESVDVVVEAWGEDGTGVRGVLAVPSLHDLLRGLLQECAEVGACYGPLTSGGGAAAGPGQRG